ncbi:hypothetical protein P3T27_005288 [Kitasatospora sp. MAA19]|uniref:hypothetical protein n=1 Tax=unclassified Kitasatospora TaxID=2633591 RepID=UPI002476B924|nr:hypothetical protein [Kitasatospora sp. MAA19]MDH6708548.1 hypothetical protein [Kitasatospora sp. MAA19]
MAHDGKEEDTGAHGTEPSPAETADREFASVLARLGIEMPSDLAPGVLAGYRPMRAMMELLRTVETCDV